MDGSLFSNEIDPAASALLPAGLRYQRAQLVGSRVTCNPAPSDTDQDILVLCRSGAEFELNQGLLQELEWDWCRGEGDISGGDESESYRLGELNIILTCSPTEFESFMLATRISTRLNVLDKGDRKALFNAIMYGEG